MATTRLTNSEFGRRTGCHHSMASRIRSGHRLPGIDLLDRISKEFQIDLVDLIAARRDDMALQEKGKPMHHTADILARITAEVESGSESKLAAV